MMFLLEWNLSIKLNDHSLLDVYFYESVFAVHTPHTHTHTYIYMYIYACVCVCGVCVCVCVCVCAY